MKKILTIAGVLFSAYCMAQTTMTPELLWQLGRVSALGISKDKKYVVYSVGMPNVGDNKINKKQYKIPVSGGTAVEIANSETILPNDRISPDGKYILKSEDVKIKKITGFDFYPDLPKSNVYVLDALHYRHWDTWEDGKYGHVCFAPLLNGKKSLFTDIMKNEPYDCPQKPFGGDEDFIWSPDSKKIIYVAKKQYGTAYTMTTNTDLYEYSIEKNTTRNITEGMNGYDVSPAFNKQGTLAWLSMKRDVYEADKQDIIISDGDTKLNVTGSRDDIHVEKFQWSDDGKTIFFVVPKNGIMALFKVDYNATTKTASAIEQIATGDYDITGIIGQAGNTLVVSRTDMNHATELFTVNTATGTIKQLTDVNTDKYNKISLCKTEKRFVTTTDNKSMLVWLVYPPNFDPSKKYPTILYCEGGPQSPLTQFYSFRWNFQLMASQGYVIVAPNRRGMPGHGTQWNEQISKDWGGQVLDDYFSAIDELSKEPFVDKDRMGAIGASFGGYSVFALAGKHNKRFKTFIAHNGIFDFKSMFGTTEEMWFEYWEKGGAYWDKNNAIAQKSFEQSPSNFVDKWDTPIMIIQGGKDYRVPTGQGQQAFQAAQLRGIKSKLLYFPEENHWVLSAQNALVWHREFYKWLAETLK